MANFLAIFSLFVLLSFLESASTKKIIGLCPEELNRYCDCRLLGKKVQIHCYNFESIGICTVLEILEDRQKELNESCSTCTTCKRHTQLTIEKLKFSRCTEPLGEMDKFPKLNITALEFKECEITSIPLDSFIALNENLVELTIQGAKLQEIPNFKKLGLTNLQKLNLDENLITNITGPIFGGLPKLRKLSLRHNRISNISRNAFGNSDSTLELQTLDFSHNNLSRLPLEAFSIQLANLTSLKFSHNHLDKLRFNRYPKLETVNLDGNKFKDFPTSLFSGCPQLQSLDFSNNQLTKFDAKLFQQPMQNLSVLSLGQNNISEFAVEISKSLPALARLSLSQNGIKTLKGSSFANINSTHNFFWIYPKIKSATLTRNPCSSTFSNKIPVYAAENVTDPNKYISAYCYDTPTYYFDHYNH
ncbi:leucine rich repeat domain-containing protein [Ditylenchus destructor]|nr:leucine rich repeat domain-containing protein [Ditylenchus destructor]